MKLEALNLSVHRDDRAVVDEVTFDLGAGELVGLIGPNGAGKTTLLRAVVGVTPLTSGTVRIDGKPAHAMPRRERARSLAYLPQERHVEWGLPGRAIVTLGRYPYLRGFGGPSAACVAAVEQALRDVDAEEFADRSFNVLSGGERARILLARALCLRAPLLLADEPIAALDPYHQLQVMRLLRDTARAGIGVLVVMHDLTLASRFMDRLILMHEGRIVASGPPATVLSTRNMADVYRVTAVMADEQGHRVVIPWENQPGDRRP